MQLKFGLKRKKCILLIENKFKLGIKTKIQVWKGFFNFFF